MRTEQLAIWLYGTRVALIGQERGRLRLAYTDDALARYQLGVPVLSLSLPLRPERYPHGVVRSFVDGLLPEGESRQVIANDLGLLREDTLGLIRALGRDCAGALVIQPEGDAPPPQPTTLTAQSLDDAELDGLVANLRSAPLGIDGRVRLSLAGVQEKLLLTRMPDGGWGRPVDGTPSTHILKPQIDRLPQTVENEVFCMRLAAHLGLRAPAVEMTTIGSRRLTVVERYDRRVHPDGVVERIHQEDFCQATGIPPEKKYQEDGGPSLHGIAGILQDVTAPSALDELLRAVTLNVLVGNGDAHGKNFSLLHEPSGAIRLAPTYDVVSTLVYGDDRLAMYVDDVRRTNRVTAERLINEAVWWGMSRRFAIEVVTDVLERVPAAVEAARTDPDELPAEVPTVVDSQLKQMRSSSVG
ncbi:MAG: type II toxin-antitoxin system HipA family toxin [Actinomycetota bacterium]